MGKTRRGQRNKKYQPTDLENLDLNDVDEIENKTKKWHEDLVDDPDDFKMLTANEINQLKDEARVVLENDVLHYKYKSSSAKNQSENEWLKTMVSRGTSQDRIAASVVLIQNSPLHGLSIIRNLMNLVNASKRECTKAMDVLSELFITDLLIPEKKLRPFENRPLSLLEKLSNGDLVKRKFFLKIWYFEDSLKKEYLNFIQAVNTVARDTVPSNRAKSVTTMQKLLAANPEQEALLLSNLVNKIGDSSPNVASKVSLSLTKLLEEHPKMKTIVMETIEKLLFRPNISAKAQYYSICFLTQYILTYEEAELANRLIEIYFSFFKGCIKQGNIDSKLLSALLVGSKRAFPYAEKDGLKIKEHIDTMYKIVHIAKFNVSLHALYLLFQVSDHDTAIPDRFYSALYQKMLDPDLSTSSHHTMFINLVFRAMSKDIEQKRIKVFIKRLLQICHFIPVPVACGILIMISYLFSKIEDLQSLTMFTTEFNDENNEESDEEHYEDIKLQEIQEQTVSDSDSKKSSQAKGDHEKMPVASSWYHVSNLKGSSGRQKQHKKENKMFGRNPLFVSNGPCVYTELLSLATHFHPTVALYANHLIEGKMIRYSGDPLNDFALIRFLDRWVFKNPKTLAEDKPASKFSREGRYFTAKVKTLPVKSEEYLNTPEGLIPPEELFIYRHLKKQEAEGKLIIKRNEDDEGDVSSIASDEFDGMIGQLLGGKVEFDYAEGIKKLPAATEKRKNKKEGNDFDDSEGDDDDDDDDDDDLDYSKLEEEFSDLDDLDDVEDVAFDGSDEDDFTFTMSDVEEDEKEYKNKKKSKVAKSEGKKSKKGVDNSVFVPAEEFAQMLENTGDQVAKFPSLAKMSNKDNAGVKQLNWEMKRNYWLHGNHNKRKRNGGGGNKKHIKKFKKR